MHKLEITTLNLSIFPSLSVNICSLEAHVGPGKLPNINWDAREVHLEDKHKQTQINDQATVRD